MGVEISESEAVRIAKQACAEKSLRWREPYRVKTGWRSWTILMPSNVLGGNAVISVSKNSGEAKVRYYAR
jgi:hypothetical protein